MSNSVELGVATDYSDKIHDISKMGPEDLKKEASIPDGFSQIVASEYHQGWRAVLSAGLYDSSIDDYHAALVKDQSGVCLILDYDAAKQSAGSHIERFEFFDYPNDLYIVFYVDPVSPGRVFARIGTGKGIGSIKIKREPLGVRIKADHLLKSFSHEILSKISYHFDADRGIQLRVFWHPVEQALLICFDDFLPEVQS